MDKEPKMTTDQVVEVDALSREKSVVVPSGNMHVDDLRANIARAREQAALTIDEIERRLSFENIKEQVKERAQKFLTIGKVNNMANQTGETSKRWASTVFDTIKEHPLPSIMIGGGLAWLIASSVGGTLEDVPDYKERRKSEGVDESGTYGMGFIERRKSDITNFKEGAGQRSEKIKSGIRDKAFRVKEKSSQLSDQMRQKTAQTAAQVKEGLKDLSGSASEYGRQIQESISQKSEGTTSGFFRSMQNHPLAVAGVLMAAGAVAGLLIPESRYEDKKLGPARDRMLDQAREKGHETLSKAESVAREAVESAKDEADRQGLIHRESADRAEEKVKAAGEDVRSKVVKSSQTWGESEEKF